MQIGGVDGVDVSAIVETKVNNVVEFRQVLKSHAARYQEQRFAWRWMKLARSNVSEILLNCSIDPDLMSPSKYFSESHMVISVHMRNENALQFSKQINDATGDFAIF